MWLTNQQPCWQPINQLACSSARIIIPFLGLKISKRCLKPPTPKYKEFPKSEGVASVIRHDHDIVQVNLWVTPGCVRPWASAPSCAAIIFSLAVLKNCTRFEMITSLKAGAADAPTRWWSESSKSKNGKWWQEWQYHKCIVAVRRMTIVIIITIVYNIKE